MARELDVELRDGASVRTAVEGSGPPVVLCHGGPGLWDYTAGLASLLRDDLTVHRWHQRGCGPSQPWPAYGIDVAVADLQDLKQAWGVTEPWVVIGHSWGAYLALLTALRHERSTRSVVYLSGTGLQSWWRAEGRAAYGEERSARLGPERDARLLELGGRERSASEEREYRALAWCTDVAGADPDAPALADMLDAPHAIRVDINRSLIPSVDDEASLLAGLDGCQVPFLVVHGSEDPRPADGARQLAALLPRSTFHLLDGAGHLPWVERRAELRELIVSFAA